MCSTHALRTNVVHSRTRIATQAKTQIPIYPVQATNNYYGYGNGFGFGNGNRIVGGTRYDQANQNSRNQGYQGAQFFGTAPNVQGSSLEEAILLFLLLTLRFDTNGDGGLNPAEIQQFATALLNNELNLNQAANQLPQRR